mmetsp:Transcript_5098/g.4315  ORF Transcript_5098/g.4315 Transcript_5098/m.4315 type:complete len:151 (+) Transcript_5098:143-595(+)
MRSFTVFAFIALISLVASQFKFKSAQDVTVGNFATLNGADTEITAASTENGQVTLTGTDLYSGDSVSITVNPTFTIVTFDVENSQATGYSIDESGTWLSLSNNVHRPEGAIVPEGSEGDAVRAAAANGEVQVNIREYLGNKIVTGLAQGE